MSGTPAELFLESKSIEEFKDRLVALEGEFSLEPENMIDLGTEYFKRFPDSFSDRNMENVHAGYTIARACIAERIISGIDPADRPRMREMFENISIMDEVIVLLGERRGAEKLKSYHREIARNLEEVRTNIDKIPKGMIKERFIGGITKFYNVLYLMKCGIDKLGDTPA